jgi:hypothetical protein
MAKMVSPPAALVLLATYGILFGQEPAPPPEQTSPPPQQQPLSPQQLDDLVAPVALYPDPLLGQLLAASTYPLELIEAQQWLQQNRGLTGQALVDAARQQNWDPSVQALVVFPDILGRLTSDIRWTTDLGNAFLAQQADVMAAVQRMRTRAQANGRLAPTPQQNVVTQNQGGQSVIEIQPANPNIVYVPSYNPLYVWGPPVFGVYPPLWYPGIDIGFGFGPGIEIGAFFGGWGGWGWGGWGWGFNWFGGGIFVNDRFFHRFGFNDWHGEGYGVRAWAHDPEHRLGVPYSNRGLAARYQGGERRGGGGFQNREGFRSNGTEGRTAAPAQRFGGQGFEQHNFGSGHSAFGGIHSGGQTRMESDHGAFSMGHFGGGGGGHFGGGGRR